MAISWPLASECFSLTQRCWKTFESVRRTFARGDEPGKDAYNPVKRSTSGGRSHRACPWIVRSTMRVCLNLSATGTGMAIVSFLCTPLCKFCPDLHLSALRQFSPAAQILLFVRDSGGLLNFGFRSGSSPRVPHRNSTDCTIHV